MFNPSQYLSRGLYSFGDAAKLLRVDLTVLRYWLGERDGVEPVIHREFAGQPLLSFAELMELHFIKLFRDRDVSFQAIRKASRAAADKYGANYPFSVKRFDTDGRSIFATLHSQETNRELIEDIRNGQFVFSSVIKPFFKRLDYLPTNDAGRYWPLRTSSRNHGRIVLDPERRFGQPLDAATGVPTRALMQAVNAGNGQDVKTVAKWFDVPVEAVTAAIRFEKSLST